MSAEGTYTVQVPLPAGMADITPEEKAWLEEDIRRRLTEHFELDAEKLAHDIMFGTDLTGSENPI